MSDNGPTAAEMGVTKKDLGLEQPSIIEGHKDKSIDAYANRYKLDSKIVERVKGIAIHVDDNERFKRERGYFTRESIEAKVKKAKGYDLVEDSERKREIDDLVQVEIEAAYSRKSEQDRDKEFEDTGGTYIQRKDGQEMVFLQSSSQELSLEGCLTHELGHALSARGFNIGAGFHEGPGLVAYVESRPLNEAATEILRIGAEMPDTEDQEILDLIFKGQVECGYNMEVKTLAGILIATTLPGGRPVSIDTLAGFYFGKVTRNPVIATEDFKELLTESVRDDYKHLVEGFIPEKGSLGVSGNQI